MTLVWIILSVVLIGLISMIGVFFFAQGRDTKKATSYLISLASGTMLGTALLHLIPESLEVNSEHALIAISGGLFFFFILEKFLIWRHCHLHQHPEDHTRPTAAKMVVVGDAIHNFIDGIIIAGAFMAGPAVGFPVAIAIILHEIPQELGDFAILIHGGYPVRKAILFNGLTAGTALIGALIGYFCLSSVPAIQALLLPLAAGGFLYIALADLIPQLHLQVALRQSILQIMLVAGGFFLVLLLKHAH